MVTPRVAFALLALIGLAACSGDHDGSDGAPATTTAAPDAPAATTPPTPADGSLFAPGDIDAGLQPWVDDATTELAARLGVDRGAVSTVSAVLVMWPDPSLGCPEPDRQYATIVTDGAVIELAVDGTVYRFHAGGDSGPFLCERPIAEAPPRG